MNGAQDLQFGDHGTALVDLSSLDQGVAISRNAGGDFFMVGTTLRTDHVHSQFLIAKMDADGNPVTEFAGTGHEFIGVGANSADVATAVQADAAGNAYVVGTTVTDNIVQTVVMGVSANGDYLPFADGGFHLIDFAGGVYGDSAAWPDATGRLTIAAYTADVNTTSDFAVARVLTAQPEEIFASGFEGPM